MPDPYEGIDFEEISEATGLAVDEIKCLKVFRPVRHEEAGLPLCRRSWRDHEGDGLPSHRGGVEGLAQRDRWTALAILRSASSASCAPPSWWRTLTWRR